MINVITAMRIRLARSSLAQRFLGGAVWSVSGSIFSNGAALIMLMFVARLLGKEVYGQFIVIQSTLSMVGVFAGFGIGTAATRYAAELKTRDTVRLGHIITLAERTILIFGFIASSGLVFFSEWMAIHVLNEKRLSMPLAISACAVLFTALDSYQKSVLIGFESMRSYAIGAVIGVIAGFPIMLLAADNYGLQGTAVALVFNAMLQALFSRYQMIHELKKYKVQRSAIGSMSEWPVLWKFAFPALLSGAMVGPAHWAAQAILANTVNGYAQIAVLGVAMQWFGVILFIPGTAGRVILPILTDHMTKNDHASSRKILLYAMGANAIVAVPMAIIISVFSPNILKLYGIGFGSDYIALVLAVTTASLLAILSPVGTLLAASSRMWLGALMNAGWAIVYVGLAYFLAANGAIGIVVALGIGYIIHSSWTFWFAFSYSKFLKAH